MNTLLALIFFFPFYWMVITSFKTLGDTVLFPPELIPSTLQWQSYIDAFRAIPFLHFFCNSLIVTFSILVLQMFTIIPAAYAFARYEFKGSRFLFGIAMVAMMIPVQLTFLPLFILFSQLGLINSYASLILPFASSAFGIFMLRQAFKQVPQELVEAARMDHASEWRIICKVFLPLARPVLVTLALLTFISTWNDYFWPLVLTTSDAVRTLPVGIASLRNVESGMYYNTLMAGNVMLILPIMLVFLYAQKQIIKAFTYMGDK
jgi:sn-glycerol 3-phosphate transport system permease protein